MLFKFLIFTFIFVVFINDRQVTGKPQLSNSDLINNEPFRLPQNLIPSNYRLTFRPIIDESLVFTRYTVPSNVSITFQCVAATKEIILHSSELEIQYNTIEVIDVSTSEQLTVEESALEPEFDFLKIILTNSLEQGKEYVVSMSFDAKIWTDRLDGLYLLDYLEGTTTKYIATTLFAPHNARRLYPCFDEPSYKATFEVGIIRLEKYKSRSNMEIIETQPDAIPGWFYDLYTVSVKMSTYLFAYEVSELATHIGFQGISNRPVQVHARKDLIDKNGGKYATDMSISALTFYENYFNHPYELTKLDSIALPKFYYSAMENWGLITYNENVLIYIDQETTEEERWRITGIIGHEVAHQWFGNLVTCNWWDAVWLNEGFASYLAYLNYDPINNDFEPEKLFVNEEHQDALYYDAGPNTHAVAAPVTDHGKISGVYDTIAYKKGASLLKMIQNFVTEGVFKQSLNTYLTRMKFKPVSQNDLFDALSYHTGLIDVGVNKISIEEIMDGWTFQDGFPLLRVKVTGPNQINIYQSKYLNSTSSDSWWIPISIATQSEPRFENNQAKFWIPRDYDGIAINHIATDNWAIINPEATGFYRVQYDDIMSQLIINQLESNPNTISAIARSQLVDDSLALAFNDLISVENGMQILGYFAKETELSVWNSALVYINKFNEMFSSRNEFTNFKEFIGPKVIGALSEIGLKQQTNEKGPKVILRSKLLPYACQFENKECVDYAIELFTSWKTTTINPIPVDIRNSIYCTAIKDGNEEADFFNFLADKYSIEKIINEKTRMLNALACIQTNSAIDSVLSSILLETSKIQKDDKIKFLQRFLMNPIARPKTFTYITENFADFFDLFDNHDAITSMVSELKKFWNEPSELTQIQNFYNENKDALAPVSGAILAAIDEIENNISWRQRYYDKLSSYFNGP